MQALPPEQHRTPRNRHLERYESTAELFIAICVNDALGRYLLCVVRLDNDHLEALYSSE